MQAVLAQLRSYLGGWKGYYGHIETPSKLDELDGWIRRPLRCYQLQQWGRGKGTYKALKALGVSHEIISRSSKGPWRTSISGIVHRTLSNKYLEGLGYKPLYRKQ